MFPPGHYEKADLNFTQPLHETAIPKNPRKVGPVALRPDPRRTRRGIFGTSTLERARILWNRAKLDAFASLDLN